MIKLDVLTGKLADDFDQADDDFAYHYLTPSIRTYRGSYPMVDHINMPMFEQTAEFFITASFEFEYEVSQSNVTPDPMTSENYCENFRICTT